MVSISKEDLSTLQKRNPHLIFVIGYPYSGKSTQIKKIANDFKYSSVDVKQLIEKESKIDSDLGYTIKDCLERGDDIQTSTLCALVVKGIIESGNESVLIEGFPETLEQALYFEQHILPINLIIKLNCQPEICRERCEYILKEGNKKSPEDFQRLYDRMTNSYKELIDFYSSYGIVRDIDANKTSPEVNTLVKQSLYPIIYTIIGKRYSGKTTLSKVLNSKMGITLLDFAEFLKEPNIANRINENNYVISQFILKLRKMRDIRVLIENFPQTQEQYGYFVNNCKNIEKIYYLNADDSSCLERANKIKEGDCNYTDCSSLENLLFEFNQKKPFIEFLRKKTKIQDIDVNNHEILTIERMIKQIQPYCAFINIDGGDEKIK
jgi:adenylate kinase family enzyme